MSKNSDYLTYEEIAAALPDCLSGWNEAALISVGRQTRAPLKFTRLGNRKSPPMWRRGALLDWFDNKYRHSAPELAAEIAARLQSPKSPTTAKHKTKGGSSS